MSEGDVSRIRDEDVLRRMWQQTEDFSRKKEIRAHMYRLREERLRNLYSPEPAARPDAKGCEFTSAQGHVKSFADQTFQSMKSKEVRDAGSPPKEFTYRGQDLKELSNAGWNVESENRTTDDGHTNVKTVQANIEGRYDVEGGRGQFAAIDRQKQAVTEYHDDNTSLKKNESSSNTAAHEQVVRQTDDGTRISSSTSSSTSTSKFQQVSTTKQESVPYLTNDDYDLSRQTLYDTNRNEEFTKRQIIKTSDYDQNLRRTDFEKGELVSRKVDYPDDNTKVVVETRCLPDGTRVTSTRREFRAPATQNSHSEHHSYQTRNENKSHYTSSHQQSDVKNSTSKLIRNSTDKRSTDIVDSQRNVDDYDFKRSQIDYSTNKTDDFSQMTKRNITQQHHDTRADQTKRTVDEFDSRQNQNIHHFTSEKDDHSQIKRATDQIISDTTKIDETVSSHDIQNIKNNVRDVRQMRNNEDYIQNVTVTSYDKNNIKHDVQDTRQMRDDEIRVNKMNVTSFNDQNIKQNVEDVRRVRGNEELIHRVTISSKDDQNIKWDTKDIRQVRDDEEHIHKVALSSRGDQRINRDSHDIHRVRDNEERVHNVTINVVDKQNIKHDKQDICHIKENERIHKVTTDKTVKEVIERKTSDQTTYQSDYNPRKISNDLSPTHQAWASTLRGDTPTSTRPSTRASSPGGKTFRSSTSSLRSSVSPDKTSRKPPSRGGSPNKADRSSPTRHTPDIYSSTHTTHSVTETNTNRYTSPERKPPLSSNRPSFSPDRQKPQDHHRPSKSPEKRPQDYTRKPSASPERKPGYTSTPTDNYPRTVSPSRPFDNNKSPSKSSPSPERKPGYLPSDVSPTLDSNTPRNVSPHRPSLSPNKEPVNGIPKSSSPRTSVSPTRIIGHQQPKTYYPDAELKYPESISPTRPIDARNDNVKKQSASPDRKPSHQPSDVKPSSNSTHPSTISPYRSSASPDKQPTESYPKEISSTKPGYSVTEEPDFKHPKEKSDSTPHASYPKESTPTRQSISPTRKPDYVRPSTPIRSSPEKYSKEPSPTPILKKKSTDQSVPEPSQNRPSVSPDRKPGYMIPTSASKPNSTSPTKSPLSPDRRSPIKHAPSQSPNRKQSYIKTTSDIREDHYKFVDEETKTYSRSNYKDAEHIQPTSPVNPDKYRKPKDKDSSPSKTTSPRSTFRNGSRSPSPPKEVTFTEDIIQTTKHDQIDKSEITISSITDTITKYDKHTEDVTTLNRAPKDSSPVKEFPGREPSPSRYNTYDKNNCRNETKEKITIVNKNTEDIKCDSLTRRPKSSSPQKVPDLPISPTKKPLRDSVSPQKSPSKDDKYKSTTDFINTEKTNEEIYKKPTTKDHPRQLVTPSTSPTRKPKVTETAPSTGQSSPTTSVSGFVYFSTAQPVKNIVTDLDDQYNEFESNRTEEITTAYKRPENLPVEKTQTPSKIPCRSPSPEKRPTPIKDNLPRKSSLKKPSTDFSQVSPTEKPPSSFLVSPSIESQDFPEHKVVKKDHPYKPTSDSPIKPKPPLERRETYEERCRKILGMVDDTTTESTTTTYLQEPQSNTSSPSVSPCRSPAPKEHSPVRDQLVREPDFTIRECEDGVNKSVDTHDHISLTTKKVKSSSRDNSPTKLQDIISEQKINVKSNIISTNKDSYKDKTVKTFSDEYPSPRQSPERKPTGQTFDEKPNRDTKQPHIDSAKRTSSSPVKTISDKIPETSGKRSSVDSDKRPGYQQPTNKRVTSDQPRTPSPSKSTPKDNFPSKQTFPLERKPESQQPKTSPEKKPGDEKSTEPTTPRLSASPDRKPGFMKPTAITSTKTTSTVHDVSSKHNVTTTERTQNVQKQSTLFKPLEPPLHDKEPKVTPKKQPEEPKQYSTPSTVKIYKVTDENVEFITSEREQEVLDRVQKSLRQLSPNRNEKSPSREKSPGKTTSLHDIDINTESITIKLTTNDIENLTDECIVPEQDIKRPTKLKDEKVSNKPSSRNTSPTKKTSSVPSPVKGTTVVDKTIGSSTKSRSISPKKPVSPTERPQSPQVPKVSGIKPRDQIPSHLTRKPTSGPTSPVKMTEKTITLDSKKVDTSKQTVTKTSTIKTTASRLVPSPTRTQKTKEPGHPTKTLNKENITPGKDAETKVTRTTSDITIKTKKVSPVRVKSKPEIQINDVTTKTVRQTTILKTPKCTLKEPQKLPNKPKSVTALNTSLDEDDVIVDVQQAKSSRENSPDRICPTPVGFDDDVGTPRYPDQVSEPDDEFRRRTYHTIHETESIVDDIVEIGEDDELFVIRTETSRDSETDKYLLSVTGKVSKFTNKIGSTTAPSQPKDTTILFKDTERKVHSDFTDENLKSDECLLSVSEKVNKFAKGPRETKDKSPSRRIVDEYDKDTVYQDDYTKLSVNDKAHLFIETAENVKTPKSKPAQKVERPDFSNVDDSLKSDDCLLSVSDKVNKFVKTAEQFLTESQEVEEKEKRIKEQHDKIMRQIVDDTDEESYEIISNKKNIVRETVDRNDTKTPDRSDSKPTSSTKDYITTHNKAKEQPTAKPAERSPTVKVTTLRSSEAVKKAKALFENIASTTQKVKDTTHSKTTKLTDIGVMKKSPKTDTTIVLQTSTEETRSVIPDVDNEVDTAPYEAQPKPDIHYPSQSYDDQPRRSPMRLVTQSPEVSRTKSPMRHVEITATSTTKSVLPKHPSVPRSESPKQPRPDNDKHEKPQDKIPGYLRPTKTSQIKEETKVTEELEVSSRRGSGKFGVELRRTSVERSTASSERRRDSVEHHQPCIEDIFDLDLLEQMLEKVVGYEQRRRIRAQIRVARKKVESEHATDTTTFTRTTKQTTVTATKDKSPERKPHNRSPDRKTIQQKAISPEGQSKPVSAKTGLDRHQPKEHLIPVINGHSKEPAKSISDKRQRPHSPAKPASKSTLTTRSPVRQPSPDKKARTQSPTKTPTKPGKPNRFNEYASAYMKKVGLNETEKAKYSETKSKKINEIEDRRRVKQIEEHKTTETKSITSTSRSFTERTSSKDTIEIVHMNGKRSPSLEKRYSPERVHPQQKAPDRGVFSVERKSETPERNTQSPERKAQSPERKAQMPVRKAQSPGRRTISPERKVESPVHRTGSPEYKCQSPMRKAQSPERKAQSPERIVRSPTPEVKRPKSDVTKKETIIKTVYDIEKKIPHKQVQEERPSWVTNRNLKKITSETRTFSSKKLESDKPKYRATSPSKVISKPIDVITSSYGPGPLDADGRPLFGIKALRNGATNYQVKGTVIRQEFHSRNGGEPEGTVSVTAYSSEPEELEKLLQVQGERPSRLHGLAAITTTKKFGGDTGTTLQEAHSKEERATLDQFTHSDHRVSDSRIESVIDRTDFNTQKAARSIESRKEEKMTGSKSVDRREDKTQGQRTEEKRERSDRRVEDRKNVRQSSVKSLTEKYIKSASDTSKSERSAYPKAGLILRTATMKDSVSSDSSAHAGLARTDSEHSLASVEDTVVTTTTEQVGDGGRRTTTTTTTRSGGQTRRTQERSFLDSSTKVTGVQDILTRMKNADIVIQEGDTTEDSEARALLNKFLGATVLMAGMQNYVTEKPAGKIVVKQETVRSSGGGSKVTSSINIEDIDQCWDERVLRKLLDECTDYEQRRRLRARIRTLMAEQEACASAVTEALAAAGETLEGDTEPVDNVREEEEVTTVTSNVRRNSSEKTVSSSTTTKTSKVIESMSRPAPKPVSPFAKFRQLEKQNSTNSPNSPKTPQSPGSPSQPYFKFTDPALQTSALTIKERLLQWCRDKTRDYENVKLENFSTSWADGLAFCALVHHFLPDAFDYSQLTPDKRRHNFTLAFKVADEKAGIYPLLDVDDMVAMRKPDWKCVFTYVQSIHRRFKDQN